MRSSRIQSSGIMWCSIRFLQKFSKDCKVDLHTHGECEMPGINLTFFWYVFKYSLMWQYLRKHKPLLSFLCARDFTGTTSFRFLKNSQGFSKLPALQQLWVMGWVKGWSGAWHTQQDVPNVCSFSNLSY